MQSLAIELAALDEFKSFLEQFREELGGKLIMYGNKFLASREAGLPVEIADYYAANYCDPNTQVLRNLIENIAERDLPYIRDKIRILSEA